MNQAIIQRQPRNPIGSGRLREYDAVDDDVQAVAIVIYAFLWLRRAQGAPPEQLIKATELREHFPWIQARGAIATIDAALATLAMDERLGVTMHCAGERGGRWIVELTE